MSISTFSAFLFGYNVTEQNNFIPFQEGVIEYLAELQPRGYTLTDFVTEVSRALNSAGQNEYTVTVDRNTRLITISADANFDLLLNSIYSERDAYSLLGFTGADRTGNNSYEGDTATGSVYEPQFVLQKFISFDDERVAVDNTKNVSSSAKNVENIKFGDFNIMSLEIQYVTDKIQAPDSPILNNPTGKSAYRTFMNYITDLLPIEFIPDKTDFGTFEECLLESTPEAKDGSAYRIKPMRGLFLHFESGKLTFRRIE